MKKKQRQMIGMLLALVVLAAAFLGIRQYNKDASSTTSTTEDTQETVLDVNSDDITSFSYVYEGETYSFEKEDDTWYYTDDHSLNLMQERIKAMILKVAPLKVNQVIENVTDMSQYGLANPERTIQYETADRSVIINVGNLNSMTSQYYIAFPSEMTVYAVTTNVVTGFNYTLDDGDATLIVYGCEQMFTEDADDVVSGANRTLFTNTFSGMANHETSVSIPVKSYEVSTLVINSAQILLLGLLVTVTLPIGCMIAGFVIWFCRRKK